MKLTGRKKFEFLQRMERGRKQASSKRKLCNPRARNLDKTTYRLESWTTGKLLPKVYYERTAADAAAEDLNAWVKTIYPNPRPRKNKAAAKKKPASRKAPAPKKKKAPLGRRRKLNPDEMREAEALYEQFHGRPANRTIDYDETHEYRSELAELGKLQELRFDLDEDNRSLPLRGFGNCQVAATADGRNLYFVGGDQGLDLDELGIETPKDYIELGPLTYIRYHTKKGFHDFAPIDYYHEFGEENEILPVLLYDAINRALFVAGGDYNIRPEGIVN